MSDDVTMPAPPPGFDPEAEFDNITPKTFTAVPKSSHRREGGDRELFSLVALGVLTLYLSNEKGWRPPNAEKMAAKYKEGAILIRDAIKELERAGFVVRYRTQGKGGLWKTHVRVSADPATLDDIRVWAKELTAAQDAKAAAKRAAGLSGGGRRAVAARAAAGDDQAPASDDQGDAGNAPAVTSDAATFSQVGPDGADRDSVHRDSVDRHSVQGDLKNQEKSLGEKEEKPPRSKSSTHAARSAETAGGRFTDEDQNQLTVAVDAAAEARKDRTGWSRPAVVEAVMAALDAGHPVALVCATLGELAGDAGTEYPSRLAPYLAAQARTAGTSAPAEPYRHKPEPPCATGCACWKHQAPAGQGPGISKASAKAIAAARAVLPPGKPLRRRDDLGPIAVRTQPVAAASDPLEASDAAESTAA